MIYPVLFNAVVLFRVTRTDYRDITSTTSRSKSDSTRSRVTRLSLYTGWIRANMDQGLHPGRSFVIPPTPSPPSLPLMDGGGDDGAVTRPSRHAIIDTTTTAILTVAAAYAGAATGEPRGG